MSVSAPARPDRRSSAVTTGPSTRPPRGADGVGGSAPPAAPGQERQVGLLLTGVAALLATCAAAWMGGGLFRGILPRAEAAVGGLIGVGLVVASYRSRRPNAVQFLVLPVAVVAGGAALLAASHGSPGDVPRMVRQAIKAGGLAQAPVAFDPGWRFVVVFFTAMLGAAATSVALALNRVNVAVFLPLPAVFAAALIQPTETSLSAAVVSFVLVVAALAVAYGAELAREGATSSEFEVRRLTRAAAAAALLAGGVVLLGRVGFLFPEPNRPNTTPPKKPSSHELDADRVLFTVDSAIPGPWRVGVLDTYDGHQWLLPPDDRHRLQDIPASGALPGVPSAPSSRPLVASKFTIVDSEGHELASVNGARRVRPTGLALQFDPRTENLTSRDKAVSRGATYTVESAQPPGFEELNRAGAAPASVRAFLNAPPPPAAVVALVAQAPPGSQWERLQYVRNRLHQQVVLAGEGKPAEVTPDRVIQLLSGHDNQASPFEVTAAEALLGRWVGVPSRIGYGYYAGDKPDPLVARWDVHPKHGATWLESYFEGYGWVPITSVPPKARVSFSPRQKLPNGNVGSSQQLTVSIYVPVRLFTPQQLYKVVRYWVLATLPFLLGALVVWRFYPAGLKVARRARRRRWAAQRGPRHRIAAAYAEFRDVAQDLNVADSRATPLGFLRYFDPDVEHDEMAWLMTRAVWGDLCRDTRDADAEAAESMAHSLTARLRRGQTGLNRVLSGGSRASLRQPYAPELPNLWPRPKGQRSPGTRSDSRRGWMRRRVPAVAATAGVVVALVAFGACGRDSTSSSGANRRRVLPDRLVPESLGAFTFHREPGVEAKFVTAGHRSLVTDGRVFTVHTADDVPGYLQVSALKPGLDASRQEVKNGILDRMAVGHFDPIRIGDSAVYISRAFDQTFLLSFSGDGHYFELFVARSDFAGAGELFAGLLSYQRGSEPVPVRQKQPEVNADARRGDRSVIP